MKITTKQEIALEKIALKQIEMSIALERIEMSANAGYNDIALIKILLDSHNKPKTDLQKAFKEKVKSLNDTFGIFSTTTDKDKEFFDNGIKSFLLEWCVSNNK